LSNGGIYTKTREILLRYFEFVAIVELGSGTFMATGTNTVILFLRRRSNYDFESIETGIKNFFQNHKDINIKTNFTNNTVLENGISKYVSHVWQSISLDDYISLISGEPSVAIESHEIYTDYQKKIKSKNPKDWLAQVVSLEKDKILYYILAYGQEIVLVKSGDKQDEKNFLGYEFSNRKGDEGIHPIRRGKTIDDCTLLFDPVDAESPDHVNTYILDAFSGRHDRPIVASLEQYISHVSLVDMLTWDRAELEKSISLSVKKKIKIESRWEMVRLGEIISLEY
jgi:type I restriction enzyme M protein